MKLKTVIINRHSAIGWCAIVAFLSGFTFLLNAQSVKINGIVVSMAHAEPLRDISISAMGLRIVPVATDSLGRFSIEVPDSNATLVAEYVGYKRQTINLNGRKNIIFRMVAESDYSVEDAILVPLGTMKDRDFSGSRSFLGEELLNLENTSSFDLKLKGTAAGVRNISYSGAPGSGAAIQIRGISSITGGTQPLFVMDGLILDRYQFENPISVGAYNNPLIDLNPNDIKSITILKDGASTSFYGARAANGVVLIETKKGTTGKTSLTVDISSGVANLTNLYPLLNKSQYKSYFKDLNYQAGMTPMGFAQTYGKYFYEDKSSPDFYRYSNNTNWQNEVSQSGLQQNYYLNLQGGDQVTTYSFSTGYYNENGAITGTNYNRFTIDFNLIYRISEKVRLGNVVNYSYSKKDLMDEGINLYSNPLFLSLVKAPMTAPFIYSAEGIKTITHEDEDFFRMGNPAHIITDLKNEVGVNRMLANIYLDFDLSKNLNGRISMGIDYDRQSEARFYPDYGIVSSSNAKRYSESKVNKQFMMQVDGRLNYIKTFEGGHFLDMVAGGSFQNTQMNYTYGKSINSAADYFISLSKGDADSINSNEYASIIASLYSRANYSLRNKYIVAVNVRADGSSRFGVNNRYELFYGTSGAWRISEESFLNDISAINELKLKAGVGVTGNDNIKDYAAYNMYGGAAYNLQGATKPINLGNADLHGERTTQYDLGIQFLGFNSRLGIELDVYTKNSKDLYYIKQLPSITGYSGILSNLGSVRNKGVDLTLFVRILDQGLRWDSRLNLGMYKNTVTELVDDYVEQYNGFTAIAREGESLGAFYGYKAVGIFDTDTEAATLINGLGYAPFQAGDVRFDDKNGDNIIDMQDMQIIGNPNPDLFGGWINSFSVKRWTLDINTTFSLGNEAMNVTRSQLEGMNNHFNQTIRVLKAWRKEGDASITDVPRIALNDPAGNARNSSRWVEDASFLRIQSVGLTYTVPESLLKQFFVKSALLYVKGQNIYTFSNYLGYSPDFITGTKSLGYGIDQGAFPVPRTILIGVKLGL